MWLACQFGVAGVATRLCRARGVASLMGRAAVVAGAGGPLHGTSAGQRHCNDVSAGHKQPPAGLLGSQAGRDPPSASDGGHGDRGG
jgi:hypothetical protein